jgi:hypothetical protein
MGSNAEVHTKLGAAKHQLERAIDLYTNEHDFLSAITLAGAAEEPLGMMLKMESGTNRLEHQVKMVARIQEHFGEESMSRTELIADENRVKDWLKHLQDGTDLQFDAKEEAQIIIERAVSTYAAVTGSVPHAMLPFFTFDADNA